MPKRIFSVKFTQPQYKSIKIKRIKMKNLFYATFAVLLVFTVASRAEEFDAKQKELFAKQFNKYANLCQQKDALACEQIFSMHKEGEIENDEKIMQESMENLDKLCAEKNLNACLILGNIYSINKKYKDFEKASKILSPMCESGNQDACALYGGAFREKGESKRAVELFNQACDKGSARGCDLLGRYYFREDMKQAYFYMKQACEMNEKMCYGYGLVLREAGEYIDAFYAFEKSCYNQKYNIIPCLMADSTYQHSIVANLIEAPRKLYIKLCKQAPYMKNDFCKKAKNTPPSRTFLPITEP